MPEDYEVVWRIQISADTPRLAAAMAQVIHRDPFSTANVFEVGGEIIDLDVEEETDDNPSPDHWKNHRNNHASFW